MHIRQITQTYITTIKCVTHSWFLCYKICTSVCYIATNDCALQLVAGYTSTRMLCASNKLHNMLIQLQVQDLYFGHNCHLNILSSQCLCSYIQFAYQKFPDPNAIHYKFFLLKFVLYDICIYSYVL